MVCIRHPVQWIEPARPWARSYRRPAAADTRCWSGRHGRFPADIHRFASGAADKVLNVTGSLPTMVVEGPMRALSVTNKGYIMNVGPNLSSNMTGVPTFLVHEMTHVWQSYNAVAEIDYALNSVYHQCKGFIAGGDARKAYAYTPGGWFKAYNAEQQACIVADWYAGGQPTSGFLWECIRDYVRTGAA